MPATRCSTSVASRRCCRRPSRCRSSARSPAIAAKAYIVEVRKTAKGPQIVVSRTHPGLIKRLFELEVPEIADGIVEIKACAREPGHRTKIAVWSNDHNVDPVGACVGARGGRVRMVVNELRGEKIDIVPFSEDLPDFVAKALSPAKVSQVIISDDGTQADVIVPDHQLSLAIGREGQNARLAARLTGVRIDIRSETQLAEGVPAGGYADDDVEYAEGEWVANAETGEMEWHAADGTVISEAEWARAVAGVADADAAETEAAEPATAAEDATAAETEAAEPSTQRRGDRRDAGRSVRARRRPTRRDETRRRDGAATVTLRARAARASAAAPAPAGRARALRPRRGRSARSSTGTAPGRGAWLCAQPRLLSSRGPAPGLRSGMARDRCGRDDSSALEHAARQDWKCRIGCET